MRDGEQADGGALLSMARVLLAACGLAACDGDGGPVDDGDAPTACEPEIASWYGDTLHFGLYGHPQRQINVLGNVGVSDSSSTTLSYSLDGAPFESTPLGDEPLRLVGAGDFNIEIDRSRLSEGSNTLELRAERPGRAPCSRTTTIEYSRATVWPMPWSVSFDAIDSAEELAQETQIVDGLYEMTGQGARTADKGYDRLIALGDVSWGPGYRVWAKLTIHEISSWGAVGLLVGWRGHEGLEQPSSPWPVGGLAWVRNKPGGAELQIITYEQGGSDAVPVALELGQTYELAIRTTPTAPGSMRVEARVWPTAQPPPDGPMVSYEVDARDGSAGLLAHTADVTWHAVDIARKGD